MVVSPVQHPARYATLTRPTARFLITSYSKVAMGGDKSSQKRNIKRAIEMARALDKE